jgi:hypothetical protein
MDLIMLIGYATLITIFGVLFISLILTLDLALNRERSRMRRIHLFLLDFFESPVRTIASLVGIQDADKIIIQMKNLMNLKNVQNARKKAIFLPHCARSEHCKGKPTEYGIECVKCMTCDIGRIKELAEKKGYDVYIVHGGSAVKKILDEKNYDGIIGVACIPEVKEGLELCKRHKISALGIPLLKDGCKNTIIDTDTVFQLLRAG